MEDINNWQAKFESCQYSDKLINKLVLLNTKAKNPVDIQEVKKAIYYAKKYHGDQMRESGEVYYSHPIEVAYMVAEYVTQNNTRYFKTDILVTAVLHDTIEDTELTAEIISYIFGEQVASQVKDLTRITLDGKISSTEMINLLYKKKRDKVLLIKLFDRLHNIQTVGAKSPEKIKKIVAETLENFIGLSMYLETTNIEEELIKLCYQYLPNIQSKPPLRNRDILACRREGYRLPSLI
jgi:(p)ppGpp synthase/HD superfamily hydrolase